MADLEDNHHLAALHSLADNALHDLIQRTGLQDYSDSSSPPLSGWVFAGGLDDAEFEMQYACAPQINFLKCFAENWRLGPSAKFKFPDDWKPQEGDLNPKQNIMGRLARCELDIWAQQAGDVFSPLSQEETIARHYDISSFEPDFLLSAPRCRMLWEPSVETALSKDAEHSLEHFKPIVFYVGEEREAGAVISNAFTCIPGCWMRCNPPSNYSTRVIGCKVSPIIDFALLLHPVGSSRISGVGRDLSLRISLMHPATIVGIKGPVTWPSSLAYPTPLQRPVNMDDAIKKLAMAVQPSLNAHLLNWQLRYEQLRGMPLCAGNQPPAWFLLFGVIYDAERVVIVAHIPFMVTQQEKQRRRSSDGCQPSFSYLSCVVDSIPFAPVPANTDLPRSWYLDRFRVAFALFSLQRHAFRLASLWESVSWPQEISLAEADLEREYLGPTPTPSEASDRLPNLGLPFREWSLTSSEQQAEIDEEIKERDVHAQDILPDLQKWIRDVAACTG